MVAAEPVVIQGKDVYIMKSGHLAFVEGRSLSSSGETVYFGYKVIKSEGEIKYQQLQWLSSGRCLTTESDNDQIIRRA